jgi:hypothetical protein
VKDIIETVAPKTIERTKFKFAAPAAKVCLTLGGAALADFALEENLVPSKIPSAMMTWITTQTQTCRSVLVMS